MIKVICYRCKKELKEVGALLFSIPYGYEKNQVDKFHICVKCYEFFRSFRYD
jgi:hypothetical protein